MLLLFFFSFVGTSAMNSGSSNNCDVGLWMSRDEEYFDFQLSQNWEDCKEYGGSTQLKEIKKELNRHLIEKEDVVRAWELVEPPFELTEQARDVWEVRLNQIKKVKKDSQNKSWTQYQIGDHWQKIACEENSLCITPSKFEIYVLSQSLCDVGSWLTRDKLFLNHMKTFGVYCDFPENLEELWEQLVQWSVHVDTLDQVFENIDFPSGFVLTENAKMLMGERLKRFNQVKDHFKDKTPSQYEVRQELQSLACDAGSGRVDEFESESMLTYIRHCQNVELNQKSFVAFRITYAQHYHQCISMKNLVDEFKRGIKQCITQSMTQNKFEDVAKHIDQRLISDEKDNKVWKERFEAFQTFFKQNTFDKLKYDDKSFNFFKQNTESMTFLWFSEHDLKREFHTYRYIQEFEFKAMWTYFKRSQNVHGPNKLNEKYHSHGLFFHDIGKCYEWNGNDVYFLSVTLWDPSRHIVFMNSIGCGVIYDPTNPKVDIHLMTEGNLSMGKPSKDETSRKNWTKKTCAMYIESKYIDRDYDRKECAPYRGKLGKVIVKPIDREKIKDQLEDIIISSSDRQDGYSNNECKISASHNEIAGFFYSDLKPDQKEDSRKECQKNAKLWNTQCYHLTDNFENLVIDNGDIRF